MTDRIRHLLSDSPLGLGCAGLTLRSTDDAQARAVLTAAVAANVTLFDTALAYSRDDEQGHSERLLGRVFRELGVLEEVVVATKGGHRRLAADDWPIDARPDALRSDCHDSLRHLGVDRIPLYQLNWPDPNVPIEESVGALMELREEGKVAAIGVSNVSTDQLRRAAKVAEMASVQNHLSFGERANTEQLPLCAKHSIRFIAHSPFGGPGSKLSGRWAALDEVASAVGASPQQVVLAWMRHRFPTVVPLPGPTRVETLHSCLSGAALDLTPEQLNRLDSAV